MVALRGTDDPEAGSQSSGCYADASEARSSLDVLDEEDSFASFVDSFYDTPAYASFSDAWATCLLQSGLEQGGGDPLGHAASRREHFEARAIVELSGLPPESKLLSELRDPPSALDAMWLQETLALNSALSELFDTEVREAVLDRSCRIDADALGPVLE